MIRYFRLPFLLLAFIGLVTGIATGLNRMGWDLRMLNTSMHHGAIMVGGFLGTLISLEKIIPLRKRYLLLIPASSGASVFLFFLDQPRYALILLIAAALGLSLVFLSYLIRTKDLIYFMMLCGGLCWITGNIVLIAKNSYPSAFPWWIGFILFIITSERLELTKFLPVTQQLRVLLTGFLFLYAAGIIWSFHAGGHWISAAALIAVSLWLMKNDIVGISIKKGGLQRFIATSLLCGYVAMLVTGVFLVTLRNAPFGYDIVLHTFFLGFAFSMIFAHGPVILPGVLGISAKPWHPIMYGWLILLHASLATRILADLTFYLEIRKISGWASAVAILGYFATVAALTIKIQRAHA